MLSDDLTKMTGIYITLIKVFGILISLVKKILLVEVCLFKICL